MHGREIDDAVGEDPAHRGPCGDAQPMVADRRTVTCLAEQVHARGVAEAQARQVEPDDAGGVGLGLANHAFEARGGGEVELAGGDDAGALVYDFDTEFEWGAVKHVYSIHDMKVAYLDSRIKLDFSVQAGRFHGVTPSFSFLTNHGLALLCIASDPRSRMRDIAQSLDITERAAQRIVGDLVGAGYVTRTREGRRNAYTVRFDLPAAVPLARDLQIGALLNVLVPADASSPRRDQIQAA